MKRTVTATDHDGRGPTEDHRFARVEQIGDALFDLGTETLRRVLGVARRRNTPRRAEEEQAFQERAPRLVGELFFGDLFPGGAQRLGMRPMTQ